MYTTLAILAAFVFAYSLASRLVERMFLSAGILGVGCGWALGVSGLGLLRFDVGGELLQTLAEVTLALVLFSDASGANLRVLRRERGLPLRLLLVGLPLNVGLGYLLARLLFPSLGWVEAALLATMLAPTDAALGAPVFAHPAIPARLREGLNVESGLNDGLCVPLLLVLLGIAEGQSTAGFALQLVLEELGIGLLVGLGLAHAGAEAIHRSRAHHWLEGVWAWVILPSLALLCFATAQLLGGSGFIAAFTGGLVYGARADRQDRSVLSATATGVGDTASLLTWLIFGAAVVGRVLPSLSLLNVAYAVLSLTVVRMLPVALSLAGTRLDAASTAFLGWFGPRGLASMVFVVIALRGKLPGHGTLDRTVVATICLSVLAHGLTATPLARWLGRRAEAGH